MSIISLPSWFDVLECELALVPEIRGFQGPFGGPTEVVDLIGDRWRMRATMPDGDFRWGSRTEALFNRLHGGADWLRLYHFAKPVPRGNARGSMVLASSVSQGAATLSVSGLVNTNLLRGGSFEIDSNADGLADLWAAYSAGTTGSITRDRQTGGFLPTYLQRTQAAGLGSTTADRAGIRQTDVPITESLAYTLSGYITGTSGVKAALLLEFLSAGGTTLGTATLDTITVSGSWVRYSVTGTAPANTAKANVYVYAHSMPGGPAAAQLQVDALQLEQASSVSAYAGAPTLLAGDMLGHNSEQLFQVYDDATANDIGVITVSTVNRARKAIASGQTIVWDRPTVPFQLVDANGVPTSYTRGRARGQQVEFVEAWQA